MANSIIIGQGTGTGAAAPGSNASVGLNGAPAPTSSTEIGFINGSGNEVGVSATNPLPITGTITANNASVGATGVAAPAFATEIGIIDASGHLVGSSSTNPIRIDPTGTTVQPVSGTITANQGTSPWVVSGTVAVSNFPATQTVAGAKTNNNAAPDGSNVGALIAVANAAVPAWTEGDMVVASVDLSGRMRIMGQVPADTAFTGSPVVIGGVDTAGNVQELPVADSNTTTLVQVVQVGGAVTTAAPTYTTATSNPLSLDTSGNLRVSTTPAAGATTTVVGTLTNNNAAPAATNVGVLPALANAAAPTYTEGDQVLLSVTLGGAQRSTLEGNATVSLALTTFSGSVGATATAVKVSQGRLYGWEIFNSNAAAIYVQFFNLGTGSITLGTTAPFFSLGIPAGSAANVFSTIGMGFSTAISFACTTTRTGSTSPASTVDVNFWYF